jgi:hypothetical protein
MSLRENARPPAMGSGTKMACALLAYGDARVLFATHKIVDSGKKTAEITKM